ncbi:hypothetical protein QOZ80_2AG0137000 [Eleusine coracana subsp. coracana]|nr:hypothetical protein QOZ80_2AG0137000 [Eleusine coracana subsp. coracana]
MATTAATTTSSSSSAAAQNPNPFNLKINLPPWLRGPLTFLSTPPPPPLSPPPPPPPAQNPNPFNLKINLPPWLHAPLTFLSPPPPPPPSPPPPPPPPPEPVAASARASRRLPDLRVTSEYDSMEGMFVNKVSCKLAGGLAKLRLSFHSDPQGQRILGDDLSQQLFAAPLVGFITKHFSVLYDVEERNTLLNADASLPGGAVQLRSSLDVKAQQGEVSVITRLGHPLYKLELSSLMPYSGLPRATFHFPIGEVSVEERRNEEEDNVLPIQGFAKSDFLDGVLTAEYSDNNLNLKYRYKDNELTLIPSVSLPSHAASVDFKRRFGPCDKLSYHYHFDSADWNAVYKHTVGKNFKVKAGYDSSVELGWASLWVGEEDGKTKTAPMKTRMQLMVQVPRDNYQNPTFLFRVKKRWDL